MSKLKCRFALAVAVTAGCLAVAGPAHAGTWVRFWEGDIPPQQNKQTSSHQLRYDRLMDWQGGGCLRSWYRNNGSVVEYYFIEECDGFMSDGRMSSASAWTYCRNTNSFYVYASCYTCVNGDCYV